MGEIGTYGDIKEYIRSELKRMWHQKYYKYIEEYINNMTPIQIDYWEAWQRGFKTI